MNKLFLKFSVQGMKLSRTNNPPIVDGSRKYIHAGFVFSADWDGCDKFVLVARNNETYTYLINKDGEAEIPVEAIRTAGSFDLTVFGVNGDVKITTNSVSVSIASTEFHDNPAGEETRMTGDFLTTTINAVKEYSEDAETSATNASTASQQSNFHADRASNEATRAKTNADSAKQYADDAKNYSENVNVFIPAVSSDGVISWTNEKGLDNPAPVNIRGPIGLTGPQGLVGPVGPVGPAGKDGVIPAEQLAQITKNAEDITEQSGEIMQLQNSKIDDVKINGTSIVTDNVADIPIGDNDNLGVFKVSTTYGVTSVNGQLRVNQATNSVVDGRNSSRPITPSNIDYAVKQAMCDGKGAEWTDEEKAKARERIGVDEWKLIIDVITEEESNLLVFDIPASSKLKLYIIFPKFNASYKLGVSYIAPNDHPDAVSRIYLTDGNSELFVNSLSPYAQKYILGTFELMNDLSWVTSFDAQNYNTYHNTPYAGIYQMWNQKFPNGYTKFGIKTTNPLPIGTVIKVWGVKL